MLSRCFDQLMQGLDSIKISVLAAFVVGGPWVPLTGREYSIRTLGNRNLGTQVEDRNARSDLLS